MKKSGKRSCQSCNISPVRNGSRRIEQLGGAITGVNAAPTVAVTATPPQGYISTKHQPATYPTVAGRGIRNQCYQCSASAFPLDTNPCLVRSRHYLQPWTERPAWYFDLTQPFIGGRPTRQASHVNAIPRTMRFDTANLTSRNFYCQQPYWRGSCV